MSATVGEALSRVEHLLEKGEYRDALELVKTLRARQGLSAEDHLACALLESRLALKLEEIEKALTLAERTLHMARGQENPLRMVDALIIIAEGSWRSGKLDEALAAVEEGESLLEGSGLERAADLEGGTKQRRGELLHHGGIIQWYKGELDQSLESHRQCMAIMEELGNTKGIGDSLNNLGLVHWSKGNLDEALGYYQRSLAIKEEMGDNLHIASVLSNMGNIYTRTGDLDQALQCQRRSLAIREEVGNKRGIALTLINLGVVYQFRGELDQAMEHYQRGLAMSEELGMRPNIALATNNLGNISELRGDLNQALACFQRSLATYRELGMKEDIALLLANIGDIYRKKGDLERALEYNEQSLAIYEEMGNDPLIATVLLELVRVGLDGEDPAKAQQYLRRLQQVNERADNRIIDQRYRVAEALTLKTSRRARDKLRAGAILERVVAEEVGDHSLTVTAMIHLCDLLLSELKMTGEEELFERIKELTEQLLETAEQQSSHSLLAETLLLQSKLALMELDMGRARRLLTRAHAIAEEKGLHALARAVAHESDLLRSQVLKWELIIQRNPSRRAMIGLTQLDDLVEQMVQRTIAVFEEEEASAREEAPARKRPFVQGTLNYRYRIDAEIGQGGMGTVYRAHDTLLKRDVAVKVLSRSGIGTEGRARLLREAQSTAQLNHPNVVSVYDVGEVDVPGFEQTALFIVMELVEGETLHTHRPQDMDEMLAITHQVCAALEHAHTHGIVHRDLKPENVMITPDGTAKLMDFGLARTVDSRLTAEGSIIGTVFYLAPEQALAGEIDGRADLYALGVMLYELMTGRLPFDADDPVAVIFQHLHTPAVPPKEHNPGIPQAMEDLILRLLSKKPEDRPASAADVEKTIELMMAGERQRNPSG